MDFELPNGEVADFYVKKEKDNVCILALTRDKEVILARQFRPGPEEILFELPGGGIDAGRNARTAAIRELLEETGIPGEYAICGQSARLWLFHNAP
ncbi:MAG: NUDIX hydrolase [Candidatus Moraniibacteriota bacterium]